MLEIFCWKIMKKMISVQKFENQNYMDNALKHIASMDTLILRATIVNEYGNIYCTDTSIPEEYVKTIRNMTKEWMLFEGKENEYYYGGLQGDNTNILTFFYILYTRMKYAYCSFSS